MKEKNILLLLLTVVMLSFSSCIDFLEEYVIRKDGSGTYELTIDMSGMFAEEGGLGLLEEMFNNTTGEEQGYEQEDIDSSGWDIAVGEEEDEYASRMPREMDSIFYFRDMPDSVVALFGDSDFMERVYGRMKISESSGEMFVQIHLDFNEVSEIAGISNAFDKLLQQEGDLGVASMMGKSSMSSSSNPVSYRYTGKIFERKGGDPVEADREDMGEMDSFMQMMFAGATYRTVYQFPTEIKKASNPLSVIGEDKKTLSMEVPFLDYWDGDYSLENKVKLRK